MNSLLLHNLCKRFRKILHTKNISGAMASAHKGCFWGFFLIFLKSMHIITRYCIIQFVRVIFTCNFSIPYQSNKVIYTLVTLILRLVDRVFFSMRYIKFYILIRCFHMHENITGFCSMTKIV